MKKGITYRVPFAVWLHSLAGVFSSRLHGLFFGWWVVAASFLINALANGTYSLGFTVFFLPISRDLQLSRTAASLPFALARIVGGLMGPVVGTLIDRQGPGRVLAASAFLGGLGFVLLKWTDSYVMFLLVFLAVVTLGMQSGFWAASIAAVNQWFIQHRGLAMSVSQSGSSFGGAVIPPLLALATIHMGWRTAALVTGIVIWTVALPLSNILQRSPESMGLEPYGRSNRTGPPSTSVSVFPLPATKEMSLKQALRTRTYWLLTLSLGFRSMVWGAVGLHMVAIMTWKGLEESTAGYLVAVYALAWTCAVLIMGWVGDRWSKKGTVVVGSFISAGGISLLLLWDHVGIWQMVLILVLMAPNDGCWPLGLSMLGDIFGRRNFATLCGVMICVQSLMSAPAPLYAGWVYDVTEGYFWAIVPAAALICLAGVLCWALPLPRKSSVSGSSPIVPV